jgi:hypothetical protein
MAASLWHRDTEMAPGSAASVGRQAIKMMMLQKHPGSCRVPAPAPGKMLSECLLQFHSRMSNELANHEDRDCRILAIGTKALN